MLRSNIFAFLLTLFVASAPVNANVCDDYLIHGLPSADIVSISESLKIFEYLATLTVAKRLRDGYYWDLYSLVRQNDANHQGQLFSEEQINFDLRKRSLLYFEAEVNHLSSGQHSKLIVLPQFVKISLSKDYQRYSTIWNRPEARNKVIQYIEDNMESIIMNAQNIPNITSRERFGYRFSSLRFLTGYVPKPDFDAFYPVHKNNLKYAREIGKLFLWN